ncbi:Fic family protein [Enterococcus gallinarum]|nr:MULTISPECIES: Fic family protein [Enterococcus]MCR1926316.1 Fic family protein [Enterococcus gallinarum]MDT2679455.1 Fic family protein [Enterococcus gallinarum]MDT2683858.1 Fic family protein [Enterococcus gallinarum]
MLPIKLSHSGGGGRPLLISFLVLDFPSIRPFIDGNGRKSRLLFMAE